MTMLLRRPWRFLRALWQEDSAVTRVACVFAAVQLAGSMWDLPGNHGWENDGIAPLGLFSGLGGCLSPGSANRYPLLHYVISLIAALPALLLVPILSPSFAKNDLASTATSTAVMTGVSLGIKLLAIGMSVLSLLLLARYARRTSGPPAGFWTAVFFAVNLSLGYYGRVSNLDGPYLMWSLLALDRLRQLRAAPELSDYRLLGAFAAAGMATKDQAYAVVFPLLGLAAFQRPSREHGRNVLHLGGAFLAAYAVMSGAVFNPTGFGARIRLLTGPNSQDWKVYEGSWLGFRQNVLDLVSSVSEWWWPVPVLALAVLGVLYGVLVARHKQRIDTLVPLVMAAGSLALFTFVVRRAEHRFLLPSALAATYYAGLGASTLQFWSSRRFVSLVTVRGLLVLCAVTASLPCFALLATQWGDGRRVVAAWLARQPVGTQVETYGLPVYQPHFEMRGPYQVSRLQPPATKPWATLPGVLAAQGRYQDVGSRGPDVIIVAEGFASRYQERRLLPGQRLSVQEERTLSDQDAVTFLRAVTQNGWPGYRLAVVADPELPHWMRALGLGPVQVHGSTGWRTWVLVREDFKAAL